MSESCKNLIIEANSLNPEESAPLYAVVPLTPEFLRLVKSLQSIVLRNGLYRVEQVFPIEWQDNALHRISFTELSVGENSFCFIATPSLSRYPVETIPYIIGWLPEVLDQGRPEVFFGSDTDALIAFRKSELEEQRA